VDAASEFAVRSRDLEGLVTGVYRADDGKTVCVVEYLKAGELARKTNKICLKKARRAATKILRDLPMSDRHEPAPIKRLKPARSGRMTVLNRAGTGALFRGCSSSNRLSWCGKIPGLAGRSIFYGPMAKRE
jgi:hypothetical protein